MHIVINYSKLNMVLRARSITKKQLEKEALLPVTTMRKIKNGEKLPPLSIVRICEYLGCTVEQVMFVEKRREDGSLIREGKTKETWI